MSVVAIARWALARQTDRGGSGGDTTLIGVGQNAHAALVVAAGAGCDRVVIVDGLWGPWRTAAQEIDEYYALIRAVAADRAANSPPPASGTDPRATYGYGVMSSAGFAQRFWGTIDAPVLAIETPSSVTPRDERKLRSSWFGGRVDIVDLGTRDPVAIVEAITAWR
jgi:hypothetical protein